MTDSVPMMAPVKGGLVTYLQVDGAIKAADFYASAFGAELVALNPPDDKGRTMHVHLYLNGSSFMLSDAYPEHGHVHKTPAAFTLCIMTDSIDADYQRAIDAGATATMPPQDMFWGDRYGAMIDPFGVGWAMNQVKA